MNNERIRRVRYVDPVATQDPKWRKVRLRAPFRYAYQSGVPFEVEYDGQTDSGSPGDYVVVDHLGYPIRVTREQFIEQYDAVELTASERDRALEIVVAVARMLARDLVPTIRGVPVIDDPPNLHPVVAPDGVSMEKLQDLPPRPIGREDVAAFLNWPVEMVDRMMIRDPDTKSSTPISTKPAPVPSLPKTGKLPPLKPMADSKSVIPLDDPSLSDGELPVEPHPADVPRPKRKAENEDDHPEDDMPDPEPDEDPDPGGEREDEDDDLLGLLEGSDSNHAR